MALREDEDDGEPERSQRAEGNGIRWTGASPHAGAVPTRTLLVDMSTANQNQGALWCLQKVMQSLVRYLSIRGGNSTRIKST